MMGQKGAIPPPNLPKNRWDGVPHVGPTLTSGSNTLCPVPAIPLLRGFPGGVGKKKKISGELKN